MIDATAKLKGEGETKEIEINVKEVASKPEQNREDTLTSKTFVRQQIEDFVVERGIEWLQQELQDRGLNSEGPRLRLVKLLEKSYLREREREQ